MVLRPMHIVTALTIIVQLTPGVLQAETIGLLDAYTLALENDTRVQIARFEQDAASAREDQSVAQIFPRLSLFGQFSKNELEYDADVLPSRRYNGARYGAGVTQKVFDLPVMAQLKSTRAQLRSVSYRLADETQLLAVRVAENYFGILAAQRELKAFSDELQAIEQQVTQSEAMAERQLVSMTDLLDIRARRDLLAVKTIEAENNVALAQEAFYALLGERNYEPAAINAVAKQLVDVSPVEASLEAMLANNQQVMSLRADQDAAKALIERARGTAFPTAEIVVNQQHSDVGFDNTTSPPRDTFYIGVNVNWTLMEGGGGRARLREAWANYHVASERLKDIRQRLEQMLRSAHLALNASHKRMAAAENSLESAKLSYQAAIRARELGVGRVLDVLMSRSAVTRAELDSISAAFDNLMSWLELEYVGGQLNTQTLAAIDQRLSS